MTLVRLVARPMLASIFVVQGVNTLRDPQPITPAAQRLTDKVAPTLQQASSAAPTDAETLARVNGAVQAGAGIALAAGKCPRLAALTLTATLVPTTLARHAFWEADSDEDKRTQRVHFLKNVSLAGGLLVAGVDRAGKPGMRWRAKRATAEAKREGKLVSSGAKRKAKKAAGQAKKQQRKIRRSTS